MKKLIISPSLLSADFGFLSEQMELLVQGGADTIHVDVMDGAFVPNITIGQGVMKSIGARAPLPLDVHLMVHEPGRFISEFATDQVQSITVHAEACAHLDRVVQQIIDAGKLPGVALNPATPLCPVKWVLNKLWMVMIMTVNPGFGGQKFIPAMVDKIADCRKMIDTMELDTILGVDGGVTRKTAREVVDAGAEYLVAGAYIFSGEATIKSAIDALREAMR